MSSIHSETVEYSATGSTLQGYLAYDAEQQGARPGVLVLHEWWGLDDYIKRRADMLAGLGYTAFAADLYGDGKTAATPDEAGSLMNAVLNDMETGTARLKAACQYLCEQPQTDPAKLAAIGYCFGGAMALHCARIGMDLQAVASFHGVLGSFHKPAPGSVKAKILVCHGADDALVPDDQLEAFKQEMNTAAADYQIVAYPGALHGFTNPEATARGEKYGLPLAYDAGADSESWQAMLDLFNQTLR